MPSSTLKRQLLTREFGPADDRGPQLTSWGSPLWAKPTRQRPAAPQSRKGWQEPTEGLQAYIAFLLARYADSVALFQSATPTETAGTAAFNEAPALGNNLQNQFQELAEVWANETMMSSSLVEICSHWAYQRVIGMGPAVVPNILNAVSAGQRHWGWALAAITGENPAENTDSPKAAARAWLEWGERRGFVSDESTVLD
jgi:hypothetical protein